MAKVARLVRRLFRHRDSEHHAHLKLRRAVTNAKPREVAALLESGASPVWRADTDGHELNALLLACQRGDAHVLNLLLDWFFPRRPLLDEWGPPMYCMVIRAGHWDAFLRLYERNVPQTSSADASTKLPLPVFVAAESGRHQILAFLLRTQPLGWRAYEFGGHSLLSIASKHGHYECVQVLLANMVPTADAMDFALDCARKHRQAHVLVLLTSCLPGYTTHVAADDAAAFPAPSSAVSKAPSSTSSAGDIPMLGVPRSHHHHHRGSLAETDVVSDSDDEHEARDPLYGMPFSNESDEAAYQRYHPERATMDGFALLSAARDADERAKSRVAVDSERESEKENDDLRHASSGELTWDSVSSEADDERWYAMKLSEDLILPYIKSNTSTNSDASNDPFTDFDGTFHDAEDDAEDEAEDEAFSTSESEQTAVETPPPSPQSTPEQPSPLLYQEPQPQPQPLLQYFQLPPPPPSQPVALPLFQTPPLPQKVISIRSSNFRSYRTLPSIQEERHPAVEHE